MVVDHMHAALSMSPCLSSIKSMPSTGPNCTRNPRQQTENGKWKGEGYLTMHMKEDDLKDADLDIEIRVLAVLVLVLDHEREPPAVIETRRGVIFAFAFAVARCLCLCLCTAR